MVAPDGFALQLRRSVMTGQGNVAISFAEVTNDGQVVSLEYSSHLRKTETCRPGLNLTSIALVLLN